MLLVSTSVALVATPLQTSPLMFQPSVAEIPHRANMRFRPLAVTSKPSTTLSCYIITFNILRRKEMFHFMWDGGSITTQLVLSNLCLAPSSGQLSKTKDY